KRQEFVPFYQPVVNVNTGKVEGFEALLRWKHKGDTICPSTFIEYAEKKRNYSSHYRAVNGAGH
ncbi:MAG: EAL domain-containing protein, partial [Plesiomonas sp.]